MKLKRIKLAQIKKEVAPPNSRQQISLIASEINQDPISVYWDKSKRKYIIIDGRRRVVDALEAGLEEVYVLVREKPTSAELSMSALILNSGTPNYMDEADHIYNLHIHHNFEVELIAKRGNISLQTVYNRLRLRTDLIPEFQEQLRDGTINFSAAQALTKLPTKKQKELLEEQEGGKKLTASSVDEFRATHWQSTLTYAQAQFPEIEEESTPGLFLDGETVLKLISGNSTIIRHNGQQLEIKAKVLGSEEAAHAKR